MTAALLFSITRLSSIREARLSQKRQLVLQALNTCKQMELSRELTTSYVLWPEIRSALARFLPKCRSWPQLFLALLRRLQLRKAETRFW